MALFLGHTKQPARTFEGEPCKQGHTTRYVSTGTCIACRQMVTKDRRDYNREYNRRPENRRKQLNHKLTQKYGISVSEHEALYESQNGKCLICVEHLTEPHVDHDHVTLKVRGLLCKGCNLLLGYAKDSVDRLQNAVAYLQRFHK